MRAELSAHVLDDHCRESVVEARSDTGGSDLIRIGVEVRPAMGHAWCGCAGHRHLGNIGGAEHGFDCARKSREEKARAAGCNDFVPKPYSPRQLLAKIREFLR